MINIVGKERHTAKYHGVYYTYHVVVWKGGSLRCPQVPPCTAPLLLNPAFTGRVPGAEVVPSQRGFSRATNTLAKYTYFLRNIHSCC